MCGAGTDLDTDPKRDRRNQQLPINNWIRCFTSKPLPRDSGDPPPGVDAIAEDSSPLTTDANQQVSIDPASARFLSAAIAPPKDLNIQSMVMNDAENAAMNRKRRQRIVATDKNMDRFRHIAEMQNNLKEKSRSKTAYNVYRALVGNVIICTGT